MDSEFVQFCQQLETVLDQKKWQRITRRDIRQLLSAYPLLSQTIHSKDDVLFQIIARGERALEGIVITTSDGLSVKEILFEGFLTVFDAWTPFKGLLRHVTDEAAPQIISVRFIKRLEALLESVLEMATIDTSSWRGFVRVKGMMAVFSWTVYTWLHDSSCDNEKLMAIIDRRLLQAQEFAGFCGV